MREIVFYFFLFVSFVFPYFFCDFFVVAMFRMYLHMRNKQQKQKMFNIFTIAIYCQLLLLLLIYLSVIFFFVLVYIYIIFGVELADRLVVVTCSFCVRGFDIYYYIYFSMLFLFLR